MKNIKKTIISLGAITTIGAPLASVISCGGGSSLNPSETLTIARWGNDVEAASQQVAIDAFKKANPDVKIEIITLDYGKRTEQISKWAASGNLPDIIETDGADYSSYAESSIIQKLDPTKITAATLSGVAKQALGTMVGNVSSEKWTYGAVPSTQDAASFTGAQSLWGVPKEFNTLGTYINKNAYDWTRAATNIGGITLAAAADNEAGYKAYKAAWEALTSANKTNSNLYAILEHVYKTGNDQTETAAKNGYKMGPLSFTNDPNRFTQLFSDSDYTTYKGYSADQIKNNKDKLKASIKAWYPSLKEQYDHLNLQDGALTTQGHGYGWNGEAFDKKGVGAVIEGAWFTPSADIYANSDQWDIWSAPTPGLFPQGWALTTNSNDDEDAYKFMSYMASEEGSLKETSLTGANPVNKVAFATQYKDAVATQASATTAQKAKAKKIIAHAAPFVTGTGANATFNTAANGRPLLFTSEYPSFQKAWTNEFTSHLDGAIDQTTFNGIVDKIVDAWAKEVEAL